ncbi:bifunctional [glutamine synthetase] adenylyltransferase/[glutamine synthetase]-adenylyl-L-tyrosine phosphorylase [Roseomonas sp. OT10]|uniref:bifunctional [glutamine synthetase] adenylyltransferase/[glutamine synthetase]-adenylyl-L-tyrosine phosphorylase n=1 Tax=Roseomonas cutis TaxID=2897332 RepID=UPI001E4ACB59|nr:bifunctional [glutamine synthetase] adenylyltransferase/[glutamine synthetase]-adenylyl-L-tyrosine phosphorylase [Roseomonas sp. OT10]UFN47173.1 bifunctional [glutamine synthetase] adenylyltransferase/[glutamine synthetase]-adenylyl-L-tyrosine phosphorylase [Roseomonas sp. OT10]
MMPELPTRPPAPFDPAAAERLVAGFAERGTAARAYAGTEAGRALLAALGGHSPYLADLALREAEVLLRMAERGPDATFATVLDPIGRVAADAGRGPLGAVLRRAKRQGALVIAAADIAGLWDLGKVTGALSTLADTAIKAAAGLLLREAAARGELAPARANGRGCGVTILGMGKLGARELNYSSDVDLMVLFDPEAAPDPDRAQSASVRLARELVKLLEERTEEGYVFRTDLRLRPDGAATPLAVSIPASVAYYGSMGQNWERAAMVKARPVAGDKALGQAFLDEIRPFVWRRHLDFAMIADIHSIKRQIHAVHGNRGAGEELAVAGHDVKLGRGGIREIEFTVQVLELIWGGRDPKLRDPTTLGALAALAGAGRLDRRAAADLADAYAFLRTVEHRLQMVADRQTHRLPEDPDGLARIASFCGFDGVESFGAVLMGHFQRVARHYGKLFESAPDLSGEAGGNLVFTGTEDDPATLETLKGMGFTNPSGVSAAVRGWHHGHRRATRSERARELLTLLMPALLAAFAKQREPDATLARFDTLLEKQPTGVQLLSLFQRNPHLLDRVAGILGAAPALADHLARVPSALEGLLAGGTGSAAAALPDLVGAARHYEEALDGARRLVAEGRFEIDAAALEGLLDVDAAGQARSALADAAITALLPVVTRDFAARHGKVPGGAMAVVAMGKLGGREMQPASDLDLVLIYDHAPDAPESVGGGRSLPAPTYFARLAAQFVSALTSPGADGRLYEVDMRLRPSGNKGPVATSLASFERYHATESWTWERMALTRARPVAGPAALRRRIAAAAQAGIAGRAGPAVLADAVAMRARMLRDLPPDGAWDVKAMPGGLVEVEFVAQALQCAFAGKHPRIIAPTTRDALSRLARDRLLPKEEAAALIRAERLWRTIQSVLRLTVGRWKAEALPGSAEAMLLRACAPLLAEGEAVDLAALRGTMRRTAMEVRAAFERHLGPLSPAGASPAGPSPATAPSEGTAA